MPGLISPIGIGTALAYPKQATAGAPLDPLVLPGDTNPPILFEPPPGLTAGDLEVWIIATGGAQWGGCQVWISLDGSTYAYAGTIYRGGRQGILTAALSSHADPDTASTLSVDLSQSQGQLLSGSLADADAFVTLSYCDGELIAVATATLTSAFHYDLTYLRRGVYGTLVARIPRARALRALGQTIRRCSNTSTPRALSARRSTSNCLPSTSSGRHCRGSRV